MRKRINENFRDRLYLIPKFKYDNRYYDASEDLVERLEGDGYIDTTIVPLTTATPINDLSSVRRLKRAIDAVFRVYPKDERIEDGFEEIDVFVWDSDQEDVEKAERDIRLGRRHPVYVAYDLGAVEDHIGDIDEDLHVSESFSRRRLESVNSVGNLRRKNEHVKTDYSGGFSDLLKDVDIVLENYYEDGHVETVVTDNGYATVTVFSDKNEAETVSVELSYSNGIVTLTDDDGKKLKVEADVDKDEFDKLADELIKLLDKQFDKKRK